MNRKYKSGNQKRQEKRKLDEAIESQRGAIFKFIKNYKQSELVSSSENLVNEQPYQPIEVDNNENIEHIDTNPNVNLAPSVSVQDNIEENQTNERNDNSTEDLLASIDENLNE